MYRKIFIFIIFLGLFLVGNAANKKFTLVIDAGHGGHDAGAKGRSPLHGYNGDRQGLKGEGAQDNEH